MGIALFSDIIYPNEVIEEIRRWGIGTLKGNHEQNFRMFSFLLERKQFFRSISYILAISIPYQL